MDEHAIRRMLEGNGGPAGTLLRTLLYIPGKAYGLAMRARRGAYAQNILKSHKADAPVIAVGNLTAGGAGKTPMTLLLAQELARMGKTPAVLLRGYRQTGDAQSDEAALYQTLAPGLIVQVDPDRRAGARNAVDAGADVLLMDDGFQHLKLRRDLDIVLVDATAPWGGGNTIPGGLLREPKSALKHAGVVVVTRSNQVAPETLRSLKDEIRTLAAPSAPILAARHQPSGLHTGSGKELALDSLRGRDVVALSGIARPEAFLATLEELGARVVAQFAGGDHCNFDRRYVLAVLSEAASRDAVAVMTEKDGAKGIFAELAAETADNTRDDSNNVLEGVWVLGIRQQVDDEAALMEKVRGVFA